MYEAAQSSVDRAIEIRLLSHSENEITYGVALHFGFSKSVLMLLHCLLVPDPFAGFSNTQSCHDSRIHCINST